MSKNDLKASGPFQVDLTKIDGDGSFPCPKCGSVVSPEDESEKTYRIVNTKVVNDQLVELVIECSHCGSTIRLTGFEAAIEGVASR
jgi:transcription initiation factor IIE alpha subunit